MTNINTVKISRILNPTSINLGEYVINPFMGCAYACLYCYVRHNKAISKNPRPWGTYVDIRVNAPKLLEKEILLKKPKTVLLGSTTECFQDVETTYKITKEILKILNRYGVYYNILTRSPYIKEYMDILSKGFCKSIYFTVNNTSPALKNLLEPKSPDYIDRVEAINELLENNLNVIPYFSPILPWVSDIKDVFLKFPKAKAVEFESLNFRVGNIDKIIYAISAACPDLRESYIKLSKDRDYYRDFWYNIENEIKHQALLAKKGYNIYVHSFGAYFENKYS